MGGQVQQFFAIFYLDKLHHYIKHDLHLKYFLSYMDDFIILSNDKNILKEAKEKIIKYINLYKLEINENKIYIIDLKMALIF